MLQAQNGRQFNLAAKTVRTFFVEKKIEVSHSDALALIARLTGHSNYESAKASLDGAKKGVARDVQTWRELGHAVGTLDDAQLDMNVELTTGCDDNGNAQFTRPRMLVLATDSSLAAGADMFKPEQPLLVIESFEDRGDSRLDSEDVTRICMQFEVATGSSSADARAEIKRHDLLIDAIETLNADYALNIGIGEYVAYSDTQRGFWNVDFGLVDDKASATGVDDDFLIQGVGLPPLKLVKYSEAIAHVDLLPENDFAAEETPASSVGLGDFIAYSHAKNGYWSQSVGLVSDPMQATRYDLADGVLALDDAFDFELVPVKGADFANNLVLKSNLK